MTSNLQDFKRSKAIASDWVKRLVDRVNSIQRILYTKGLVALLQFVMVGEHWVNRRRSDCNTMILPE